MKEDNPSKTTSSKEFPLINFVLEHPTSKEHELSQAESKKIVGLFEGLDKHSTQKIESCSNTKDKPTQANLDSANKSYEKERER